MKYRHRIFVPWLRHLAWIAGGLFVATWVSARVVRTLATTGQLPPGSVLLAVGIVFFAVWLVVRNWRQYSARTFGRAVERSEQKRLKAAARRSGYDYKANVDCRYGGDIDVVLSRYGAQYAVEIKSWQGMCVKRGRLVKGNGRATRKDPIAQCHREAASIGGKAVLWLPRARRRRAFVFDGVLVVNGPARYLVKTLQQGENDP